MSDLLDQSSQPDTESTEYKDSNSAMPGKEEDDPYLKGKKYQKRRRTQASSAAYDDFVARLEQKWKEEKEVRDQRERTRIEREAKREEREAER